MNKRKNLVAIIAIITATIVIIACYYDYKSNMVNANATIEGYVKKVYLEDKKILVCYDINNISNEEYMGDCYIPIEKGTVFADGRALESIEQGDHIIATYTGTLAEVFPEEIDGTVLIEFKNARTK